MVTFPFQVRRETTLTWLVVGLVAAIRLRLADLPLERDEGEYGYVAQLLLRGLTPYADAFTMKLPGVPAIYAAIVHVLGETPWAIHVGLMLVTTASSALVFLIGRRLGGPLVGSVAGSAHAVLALSPGVQGLHAHATHFVVVFLAAGVHLWLSTTDEASPVRRQWRWLGCGVMFGCSLLMKQHVLPIIVFVVLAAVVPVCRRWWIRSRSGPHASSAAGADAPGVSSLMVLLGGIGAPYALTCLWLLHADALEPFWFWTVSYAAAYAEMTPLGVGTGSLQRAVMYMAPSAWPLWLLAAGGLCAVLVQERHKSLRLLALGLLASSFAATCPGLYFRPHYFIVMLPIIAVLTGFGVEALMGLARVHRPGPVIVSVVVVVAAGWPIAREHDVLLLLPPGEAARALYGTNPFVEAEVVADFIARHSSPDDRIAVLGSEPEIYFLSRRMAATGYLYMYPLMENHDSAGDMQAHLINEVEARAPKFVVMVTVPLSWLKRPTSRTTVLAWMPSFLREKYTLVGLAEIKAGQPTRYWWDADARAHAETTTSRMSVYVRTDSGGLQLERTGER